MKEKAAQKKAKDNPKKKTREPEEYIFIDPEEQDTTVEDTMPKIYKKVASRSKHLRPRRRFAWRPCWKRK